VLGTLQQGGQGREHPDRGATLPGVARCLLAGRSVAFPALVGDAEIRVQIGGGLPPSRGHFHSSGLEGIQGSGFGVEGVGRRIRWPPSAGNSKASSCFLGSGVSGGCRLGAHLEIQRGLVRFPICAGGV